MKLGLLVTTPISTCKNIGDYIQSLAAKQFLKGEYCYVEKEEVSHFESVEPVKVIMNAWYMWHPENWPPQPCIKPLLTSMHISHLTANEMFENGGKEYLIEHGPVGCRDLDTKKILDDAGIPNYFSGCLTLTLGKTYNYEGRRSGIFFVDPYIPALRYVVNGKSIFYPKNALKALWYYLNNIGKVNRLVREKVFFKSRLKLVTYYNAAMFYKAYSTLFEDEVLFSAEYLSHMVPASKDDAQETLLNKAESLIRKYAQAQLVVTSRIHCGLPCLGLETPVLFVMDKTMESDKNMFNAPGRFGGLIDLFHILKYSHDKLLWNDMKLYNKDKIKQSVQFQNKPGWRLYKDQLINLCCRFLSE